MIPAKTNSETVSRYSDGGGLDLRHTDQKRRRVSGTDPMRHHALQKSALRTESMLEPPGASPRGSQFQLVLHNEAPTRTFQSDRDRAVLRIPFCAA